MAIDNIPIEISENTQEVVLDIDDTSHPYYVGARAYVTQIAEGAIVTVIDKFGRTEATLLDGNYGNITDISYDPDTKTLKKVNGVVIDDVVTLSDVAISNDYEDLDNLPTIPTTADIEAVVGEWVGEHFDDVVPNGSVTTEKLDDDAVAGLKLSSDYRQGYTFSEVNGNAFKYKKLRSSNYKANVIASDTLMHYTNDSSFAWIQSAVYVEDLGHIILGFCKTDYSAGMLVEVDTDFTTVIRRSGSLNISHVNDLTYNPKTEKILLCPMSGNSILVVDPDTLTVIDSIDIGKASYQISYDSINDVYYIGTNNLEIYDNSFNLIETYPLPSVPVSGISVTGQGSVCYDGTFILLSQNSSYAYLTTCDLDNYEAGTYHEYKNSRYGEEAEALFDIDGTLYMVSGQDTITFTEYDSKGAFNENAASAFGFGTAIGSGSDLNNYIDVGKYYCLSSALSGVTNKPPTIAYGFSLYVITNTVDTKIQILIENTSKPIMYFRYRESTWSRWTLLNKDIGHVTSAQIIAAGGWGEFLAGLLPIQGDTLTGTMSTENNPDNLVVAHSGYAYAFYAARVHSKVIRCVMWCYDYGEEEIHAYNTTTSSWTQNGKITATSL